MKFRFLVLLIIVCFLSGCSFNKYDESSIYDEFIGSNYQIVRCIKQGDYKYNVYFDISFAVNKKVEVKLNKYECVSSKCLDSETDEMFFVAMLFMAEEESETFNYKIIENSNDYKVDFISSNSLSYFNVDDFTFKFDGKVYDVNSKNNECVDSSNLYEEDLEDKNEESGEIKVTENVHAKNCAINAVKQKLSAFAVKDINVSGTIVNTKDGQTTFTVNGTVEYINMYNAKITKNFICQISELLSCTTEILIY